LRQILWSRMTRPIDQQATGALDDEAVGWLVRVQSDAATAEDWIALTAWIETSEVNAAAFARAERFERGDF